MMFLRLRQPELLAAEFRKRCLAKTFARQNPLISHGDSTVGAHLQDVAIERRVMQAAEWQPILHGGQPFSERVGHDVRPARQGQLVAIQLTIERSCSRYRPVTGAVPVTAKTIHPVRRS